MRRVVPAADAGASGRGYGWRMLGRHGTHRLDVAIVVVLAVYGQLEAWGAPQAETAIAGPPVLNAVAFLIASTALLWRRRAPVTVVLVEAANLAALSVLAGGAGAPRVFVPPPRSGFLGAAGAPT